MKVHEFRYLSSILYNHESMEGEMRKRAAKGRKVVGSLGHIMNARIVSMEKGLRDGIVTVLISTYASKTMVWNESQRSRIQAVEMSFFKSLFSLSLSLSLSLSHTHTFLLLAQLSHKVY